MGVEYFYDEELECWLAVREDGIFMLRRRKRAWIRRERTWTLHARGSLRWDSLHQRIYLDRRWIETCSDADAARLPRLPAPVPAAPRGWADNFDPKLRVPAARHPRLAARLADTQPQTVYVVLHEDRWETLHGDGQFHYLREAHFDEARARALLRELDGEYSRGHLRVMSVQREGDQLWMPAFNVETFDHCYVKDILAKLEASLS